MNTGQKMDTQNWGSFDLGVIYCHPLYGDLGRYPLGFRFIIKVLNIGANYYKYI